jgi:hypothetical protein
MRLCGVEEEVRALGLRLHHSPLIWGAFWLARASEIESEEHKAMWLGLCFPRGEHRR